MMDPKDLAKQVTLAQFAEAHGGGLYIQGIPFALPLRFSWHWRQSPATEKYMAQAQAAKWAEFMAQNPHNGN